MKTKPQFRPWRFAALFLLAVQLAAGFASNASAAASADDFTDINGHAYEDEIYDVVEAGWWVLKDGTTTFRPNDYLKLSEMLPVVLRAADMYDDALKFTGGQCPSYPVYSYAAKQGIVVSSTCPSPSSTRTVSQMLAASARAFRLLSEDHADFYDDMVASYNGPSTKNLSYPYGIYHKHFKFAYMIGALPGWSQSSSVSSTTYGNTKVRRGHAAAIAHGILMYDIPGEVDPTPPPPPPPTPTTGWTKGKIPGIDANSIYGVYYGSWSDSLVNQIISKGYDLMIVHPRTNITPTHVSKMKNAGTKVFCYISVGEDDTLHTSSYSGGVSGPAPGYASWYYDKNGDRYPDENNDWGSYYTNAADSRWFTALKTYTNQSGQGWYGYDYSIKTLGCNGLFFDTVDTASPWGNFSSSMNSMVDLIEKIRKDLPSDRYIIINRGLFYFDTSIVSTTLRDRLRPLINGVMFESFVGESSRSYWANILNKEAVKSDGFNVFALDYVNLSSTSASQVQGICDASNGAYGWLSHVTSSSLGTMSHLAADYCY